MANAANPITAFTSTALGVSGGNAIVNMWQMFSSETIAASTSAETLLSTATGGQLGMPLSQGAYFGLWVQCTSTGVASYTVSLLQSYNDVAGNYLQPDVANIVPGSTSGSTSFANNTARVIVLAPVPMPLARLQITNNQTTAALVANAVLFEVR